MESPTWCVLLQNRGCLDLSIFHTYCEIAGNYGSLVSMTQPDLHSLFALVKQGSIPLLLECPSRQLQHVYTSGRRILASELELNNYAEAPFHSTCFTASSVSIKTAFHCGQHLRISTQQCSVSPSCRSVQVQNPQEILWHLESC